MDERGGSSGGSTTTRLLRAVEGGGGERNNERPKEPWKGEYAKSIVYGGFDAIITSFSLISSISATTSSYGVLVLGFSNLVADAITMGFGDFVSISTEQDVIKDEMRMIEWDVMNHLNNEQAELVVNIFTKYKNILVDQRMVHDKGMVPTTKQEVKPWKNGLVTFISFILFGSIPLLSFMILIPNTNNDSVKFFSACIVCALALSLLGVAKAKIASQNYMFSIAMTLFSGAIAATVAYFLG
ncbi:unnamed protein product [Lupinus luteus]|uniref:Vacuolar iron transporter n=1 Tax=Lupinus luteus TaxID=3873 RepID=A0AAV1W5R0_LUPLU